MSNIKDTKDFLYEIQKKKNNSSTKKKSAPLLGSLLDQRKNILDLKILVCVDVSGSIDERQFNQFMRQVDAIRGLSVVKVLEIDDKVIALYDYFKTNQDQVVRLQGGGGTAFHDAFVLAKKMSPDAIIFMTDGLVGDTVSEPEIPTGWVLTNSGVHPYGWGKVVMKLPPV